MLFYWLYVNFCLIQTEWIKEKIDRGEEKLSEKDSDVQLFRYRSQVRGQKGDS